MRGPAVTLSRTHPSLVKKLFALEVPEIADGSVEIVAIAREAGHRTKIAVRSTGPGVNAKGACIGPMGQRVRNVMAELHGEKIDIVDWSDDPAEFVANALSPARVSQRRGRRRGGAVRPGDRARLPALAGDRQGGPERPAGRPAHRLADRHPPGHRAGRTPDAEPTAAAAAARPSRGAAVERPRGAPDARRARPGRARPGAELRAYLRRVPGRATAVPAPRAWPGGRARADPPARAGLAGRTCIPDELPRAALRRRGVPAEPAPAGPLDDRRPRPAAFAASGHSGRAALTSARPEPLVRQASARVRHGSIPPAARQGRRVRQTSQSEESR